MEKPDEKPQKKRQKDIPFGHSPNKYKLVIKVKFKKRTKTTVEIKVPCLRRSQCYQRALEEFASNLYTNIDDEISKKIFPKNVISEFGQCIKEPIENLAEIFDRTVMFYLDKDLKLYRKDNKEVGKRLNVKFNSHEVAKQLLYEYYERVTARRHDKFGRYFLNKHKVLNKNIFSFTKAYEKAIRTCLIRVHTDLATNSDLRKHLLPKFKEPVLLKITSTGSDFHNQANQVLILEFGDLKDQV